MESTIKPKINGIGIVISKNKKNDEEIIKKQEPNENKK